MECVVIDFWNILQKKNFDPEKLLDLQIQNIYKITIKKNMDIVNNNNDIKK